MAGVDGQSVDVDGLTVYLPEHSGPSLCVTITSGDRRYSARLEFDVRDRPAGFYRLDLRTAYREELSTFTDNRLAVLAQVKDACDQPTLATIVTSSWGNLVPGPITLFVNLDNTVGVSVYDTSVGGSAVPWPCMRLEGPGYHAFNMRCVVTRTGGRRSLILPQQIGGASVRIAFELETP